MTSNIRQHDPALKGYGGFYRLYDRRRKNYDLLYCEITGYAISLLTLLHRRHRNSLYLEAAQAAGDFLLRCQLGEQEGGLGGAFPYSYGSLDNGRNDEIYAFDTAMCLSGLVDLYAETGEKRYLESARAAGEWLIHQAQNEDGSFQAMYNRETKTGGGGKLARVWYGDRGCLHAKNAIGLMKLYRATEEAAYRNAGEKVCWWVLKLQRPDGAFRAKENEKYVFTHAHCYATEGLLYAYFATGVPEFGEAARRAGKWLLSKQTGRGFFYNQYDLPVTQEITYSAQIGNLGQRLRHVVARLWIKEIRTDAVAQAARIWVLLYQLTNEERFLRAAYRAARFLMDMQVMAGDSNALGGIPFCQWQCLWRRTTSHNLTAWSTMFALHAWLLLESVQIADFLQNVEGTF